MRARVTGHGAFLSIWNFNPPPKHLAWCTLDMDKIHCPNVIRANGLGTGIAQLGLRA